VLPSSQEEGEEYEELGEGVWEDLGKEELPWDKVYAARSEEVGFMMEKGIWEMRPIKECWEKLGKGPTTVRWVDVNKGDRKVILVRSRLVARDFKGGDKGRDDLFADTPPLEAKRMLLSKAATRGKKGWRKLMFIDVKKAHLNPRWGPAFFR
jgi:hypothetical protein